MPAVGELGERNAEQCVEQGESGAEQQAELRVAEAEIGLERRCQNRDDLPIEEIEGVDQHQHGEDIIAVKRRPGRRWILGDGGRCLHAVGLFGHVLSLARFARDKRTTWQIVRRLTSDYRSG